MLKEKIESIPILGPAAKKAYRWITGKPSFSSSPEYWENRYRQGGNSGAGSYDRLAQFKAEVINDFIQKRGVRSAIEFGCGDGNQLRLFKIDSYLGFDISETTVQKCKQTYKDDPSKKFRVLSSYDDDQADLTLSLDVIYHLVEREIFEDHLQKLFDSSNKFVIVYSSNEDDHENNGVVPHVKHRNFTNWVEKHKPEFELIEKIPNRYPFDGNGERTSYADFYIFEKKG